MKEIKILNKAAEERLIKVLRQEHKLWKSWLKKWLPKIEKAQKLLYGGWSIKVELPKSAKKK